jgi:hypothetical protein
MRPICAKSLLPALLFLSQPFWESKPPERWTDREIDDIRVSSPWVERSGPAPILRIYLATAAPIEEAEIELRVRSKRPSQLDPDYLDYVRINREKAFVLAIPYDAPGSMGNAGEIQRMDQECLMTIGRRTYKILGHFPPTTDDPVLRLIFPRVVTLNDKDVVFRLYLPGMTFPEREVRFRVRDLLYHGKLEM